MFESPAGATPLTDDDIAGLIPGFLSTREDLNRVEAENIARARIEMMRQRKKFLNRDFLLTDDALKRVHRLMFGDVWKWAGKYRTHMTNIGVMPEQISFRVRDLLLNTQEMIKYIDLDNQESCDALALRFHWDLVRIHPFPNGNGRHARLMADLLAESFGQKAFSWGSEDLVDAGEMRDAYIAALRKADETRGDVSDLLTFSRHQ